MSFARILASAAMVKHLGKLFLEAKPLAREKQRDTLFELAENVVSPSGDTTGAGSIALSDDAHKNQDSQSAMRCEYEKYQQLTDKQPVR